MHHPDHKAGRGRGSPHPPGGDPCLQQFPEQNDTGSRASSAGGSLRGLELVPHPPWALVPRSAQRP